MQETAPKPFGPVDVIRFVETGLSATGSSPRSPILRGAAYIAALRGDPWRPQR